MLFLLLTLVAATSTALEVGSLRLPNNKPYISYGLGSSESNSRIICSYTLGNDEEVSTVLWQILKDEQSVGSYKWNTSETATGLLENKVNLEREDSDLELTELSYDLNANYSCTVTTTDGTEKAVTDEILLVDTTSNVINDQTFDSELECQVGFSASYFPVFPTPTVHGGLYDEDAGQYIESVSWKSVLQPNGSLAFSFADEVFYINEDTPRRPSLRHSLGITKTNGTYFSLVRGVYPIKFEHSCEEVKINANQTVSYDSNKKTCYGEPKAYLGTVKCADGFHSTAEASTVVFECQRTGQNYQWVSITNGFNKPKDLVCKSGVLTPNASISLISIAATMMLIYYKQ